MSSWTPEPNSTQSVQKYLGFVKLAAREKEQAIASKRKKKKGGV